MASKHSYRSFEDAREFTRKLGLKNVKQVGQIYIHRSKKDLGIVELNTKVL
jgi:hypothetical protein